MPRNLLHRHEGKGASHGELHNACGLQMARAGSEGVRRLCPDRRVPQISRSGYAGVQRHAVVWTGDKRSSREHPRLSVSTCLNLGMSGVAMCGADVGGFGEDCSGELLVRWTRAGALMPFFRNHSGLGTARQEPWAFGEPYESICRRWLELRYELLPYLYTVAAGGPKRFAHNAAPRHGVPPRPAHLQPRRPIHSGRRAPGRAGVPARTDATARASARRPVA